MQPDSVSLWDESSFVALHYSGPSPDNNIIDLSISNFDPVTSPSDDQHTSTNTYDVNFVSMPSKYYTLLFYTTAFPKPKLIHHRLPALDMYPQNNAVDLDLQTSLPSLEVSQFTFPDDSNLEIPMFKTLNVGLAIAERLGIVDILFDPTISHTFSLSQLPPSGLTLPPNLLPTDAQQTIPHFPLLDILPWPSVRRKLVVIFAQPERLRPPIARDPMGLIQLMHDIDDDSEGVRVVGDRDAFAEKNWEVGQAFFRNWWWVLDPQVINESNALRRRRGASPLQIGA
jgi:hypothetical protein